MVQLTYTGFYTAKDQVKSDKATQFIGIGAVGSSTHQYMLDWGNRANTGKYTREDVVFISINGKRFNRIGFSAIKSLVDMAIQAKSNFVTDSPYHRNRSSNIGEREVAQYLESNGYQEINAGYWVKV